MLNDLEDRVGALITAVNAIGTESEGLYLAIGSLFPAIIAETGRSVELAEASLASFDAKHAGGRSIDDMKALVSDAATWFRALHDRDEGFLNRINESMERLASLDSLIKGVRADSEDMEIVSLNAMTVALKSGFAGKAFSVITDELKRLSAQTIGLTESITSRGQNLLGVFSTLRDAVGRLDRFQDEFFERLETSLNESFERNRSELDEARELYSALVAEARELRRPVQTIMQEVQHQDIIRQSLGHVVISLSEAEGAARRSKDDEASEEEEIAYIASIARLSAQLLEDIVGKIDSSAEAFGRNIDEVESKVEDIEGRRLAFASRAMAESVQDAGAETVRYLEFKKSVTTTARRLAEHVRSLDDSFKSLATLLSRFKNIVVASRIEIAKNRSLGGVSTTVAGMVELTGKIETDVSGAMGTTKNFTKVAEAAMAEYAEDTSEALRERSSDLHRTLSGGGSTSRLSGLRRDAAGISTVLARVRADLAALEEERRATRETIVHFALFTPEFLSYIGDARRALADLKGLSARLGGARAELLSLEELAVSASGGTIDREIHSGRLQEMIQRFTILTHKRAAGQLGNFQVEEGSGTGEITLF